MFIEVTEILRCPRNHAESYLICGPILMSGRDVVRGALTCPICRIDYPILDGIAWFAPPDATPDASPVAPSELTAEAVHTFLDLQGGGGYLLLAGNACRLASALAALVPAVSIVGASRSGAASLATAANVSLLHAPHVLPIKGHSVRAVVLGSDVAAGPWLEAAVAALLPGLRIVIEDAAAEPAGIVELARGAGVFVGEKRSH